MELGYMVFCEEYGVSVSVCTVRYRWDGLRWGNVYPRSRKTMYANSKLQCNSEPKIRSMCYIDPYIYM